MVADVLNTSAGGVKPRVCCARPDPGGFPTRTQITAGISAGTLATGTFTYVGIKTHSDIQEFPSQALENCNGTLTCLSELPSSPEVSRASRLVQAYVSNLKQSKGHSVVVEKGTRTLDGGCRFFSGRNQALEEMSQKSRETTRRVNHVEVARHER